MHGVHVLFAFDCIPSGVFLHYPLSLHREHSLMRYCMSSMYHNLSFLGMLSKSLGQIIRVCAAMHALFHLESGEDPLPDIISSEAIEAAINYVEVCCQHTAYISGRGNIDQELDHLLTGNGGSNTLAVLSRVVCI